MRLTRSDGVAVITLNRPRVVNAINSSVREQLPLAVAAAERDSNVRVIMVRGAGQKGFCGGADITEFEAPPSALAARTAKQAITWIDVLAQARKPTIAAIHGYCLGGGLEIALACDIRIAMADATFGMPEVGLAIIPGAGGTRHPPRAVGLSNALRLILTGERIDATAAQLANGAGQRGRADRRAGHAGRKSGEEDRQPCAASRRLRQGGSASRKRTAIVSRHAARTGPIRAPDGHRRPTGGRDRIPRAPQAHVPRGIAVDRG